LQQRSGSGTWQKSLKLPGREYVGNIISLPNSCCNVAPPLQFFATHSHPLIARAPFTLV
jgi:hypothetical protein